MPKRRTSSPPPPSAPLPVPAFDLRARLPLYWQLIRGDRPIGILLLLWPTWWGLWLAADGFPPWWPLIVFTLGVWLTRSAGCVINDVADVWLDGQVQRTRQRPLPTGAVSRTEARLLFAAMMLAAFVLVLTLNTLTIWMSVVGAFLAASYPYLKRYTYLPQVYLGIAFGWGIPMAFAAVQGEVPALAWLLFLGNLFWTTAYDTWYAMVDRDDDLRAGAKSTAILFGDADLIAQSVLYATFFLTMVLLGRRAEFIWPYYAGLSLAAACVLWQFWRARDRKREHCFAAFLNNQWVGAAVFAGIAGQYLVGS